MSQILKNFLDQYLINPEGAALDSTLRDPLTAAIREVIESYGRGEYVGSDDPAEAQDRFIRELSFAISDEVSKAVSQVVAEKVALGVQAYLSTFVTTNYGLITFPGDGVFPHVHYVPPLPLNAP